MTAAISSYFPTFIGRSVLGGPSTLLGELIRACRVLADDDEAGQAWCQAHNYLGYTSYGSLSDLPWRDPTFAETKALLDAHVARFAEALEFDLQGRPLTLDHMWVNILEPGGVHTGHIHPHAVISGTLYVEVPEDAPPIRFEDPRLPLMMATPPRRKGSDLQSFVYLRPEPGAVLLWESWLRHEVPVNLSEAERVSVSFNYRW